MYIKNEYSERYAHNHFFSFRVYPGPVSRLAHLCLVRDQLKGKESTHPRKDDAD